MANLVLKNNTSGGKTSVTADEFIGNASSATKAGLLSYQPIVKTDTDIDAFLSANALKAAIWTDTSSPGTGNGILLSGGYTSTNYGFQLAIDDDPSWMIKLRQRNTDGWKEWKRIPMGDGTGASGTWGISITGNAATANSATNATNSVNAQILTRHTKCTTADELNAFIKTGGLAVTSCDAAATTMNNDGVIMSMAWGSGTYGAQIWLDDGGGEGGMAIRNSTGTAWNPWRKVFTEANYTSWVPTKTGSGASGTWGISITGNAATATTATSASSASYATSAGSASSAAYLSPARTLSGDSHALALKNEFTNNKASIQRNKLITYYSGAYGNGSQYMGYFLPGYDTTPYGGFFVAHYDSCYYVGISYGTFNQQQILTSTNYSSWAAPSSHSHSNYLPLSGGTMTGKLQVNHTIFSYQYTNSNNRAAFMWDKPGSNYTGVGACGTTDMIHFGPCDANANWVSSYNQIWRFQGGVYATGWLETDNCGTSAPGSSTPGYGRGGALYFKY